MQEKGRHNKYKIKLVGSKFQCIEANGKPSRGFLAPDMVDSFPKLYVVKHNSEVYYVGITRQDIRKRLRYGFSAKGEYGYSGYKWKNLEEVELLIWPFQDISMEVVEAIEAELVYLIRKKTGKWPKYQVEIHFHDVPESQVRVARSILHELL